MIVKSIKDVAPGETLGEDVIHENIFLVKKGTKLSKRMINLLRKRQIEKIRILMGDSDPEITSDQNYGLHSESPVISKYNSNNVKDTFFQLLSFVGYEYRYGKLLHQEKDVQLLIELFTDLHLKHQFIDQLYELKNWDHYTFVHSFDVFVLGTLLAKR